MKTIKLNFSLLIMVLFFFGCKKEHAPASTIGTPEFYFNGTIAGTATSLNAGVNNYYMYSSYAQDTNRVYNFIGDLKQTTSNLNSIQIIINDYKASALNGPTNIDSALIIGNYPYYVPGTITTNTTTTYDVQFNSSYTNGTAQTYSWNFGDGTTSALANPIHSYSQLLNYNVCLSITGASSCTNSICDSVNLLSNSVSSCRTVISYTTHPGNNQVDFSNTPTGTPPFSYSWNFGDQSTTNDTGTMANKTYIYSSPGVYQVSLRVTDSSHHSFTAEYNVATATSASCATNFTASTAQTVTATVFTTNSSFGLGAVTIIWTDATGNVYTSKNNAQPAASSFQIISIDNFPNNSNNQHTKKLHVKFNCWVYNSTHPAVQISNADAIITVAYK